MVLYTFEAQCISLTIQKINASSQIKLIGEGRLCIAAVLYKPNNDGIFRMFSHATFYYFQHKRFSE